MVSGRIIGKKPGWGLRQSCEILNPNWFLRDGGLQDLTFLIVRRYISLDSKGEIGGNRFNRSIAGNISTWIMLAHSDTMLDIPDCRQVQHGDVRGGLQVQFKVWRRMWLKVNSSSAVTYPRIYPGPSQICWRPAPCREVLQLGAAGFCFWGSTKHESTVSKLTVNPWGVKSVFCPGYTTMSAT